MKQIPFKLLRATGLSFKELVGFTTHLGLDISESGLAAKVRRNNKMTEAESAAFKQLTHSTPVDYQEFIEDLRSLWQDLDALFSEETLAPTDKPVTFDDYEPPVLEEQEELTTDDDLDITAELDESGNLTSTKEDEDLFDLGVEDEDLFDLGEDGSDFDLGGDDSFDLEKTIDSLGTADDVAPDTEEKKIDPEAFDFEEFLK
jgi:hypothetical protein